MNKILVFCSDVLPLKDMATSGGGLRSWQIIQGLQAHALDVAYSMPEECYLSRTFRENIPPDVRKSLWNPWNQDQIIETEKPDVIVLAKPALKHWKKKYDIPLVVDFHGPDVIEAEQMVKRTEPVARFMIRRNRALAKLKTIAEADFFTCAGQRQRYYFMAFLLMAGVGLDDAEVHYMPVAMSADLPPHEADPGHRSIIFAGGFYPWLNPMPALLDLAQFLTKMNNYHLEIFGGSHETNAEEKREFDAFKAEMEKNRKVTFHGTISRDQLLAWYRRASVAFEVMPRNLERELAFTTRTVEFMWAGLPVIYNNYAELSDLIRRYQAGWLVTPGNTTELQAVLKLVAEDTDAVRLASENAQRLVRENLTYEKVITPLADFCLNPRRRERSDNCNGLILTSDAANPDPRLMERIYLAYKTRSRRDFAAACLRHAFLLARRKLGKP